MPLLFAVVMLESFGIPLPGETALIAFGVLASQGHYSIVEVIAVAAAGAIIGDNLGYALIGRLGGRRLFERTGYGRRYADRFLPEAERLMAKHGGKVVFFGRFISDSPLHGRLGGRHRADAVVEVPLLERRRRHLLGDGGRARRLLRGAPPRPTRSSATGSTPPSRSQAVVLIGFFFTHFGKKWLEKRL